MKLEELARRSVDAARVSVAHLDPPPIGEERRQQSWPVPVLLRAAAVVLIAGVVAVLLLADGSGDDGEAELTVAGVQDIPRLGLPELSAWNVVAAVELGTLTDEGLGGELPSFEYYGSDQSEGATVLVVSMTGDEEADLSGAGYQEVLVRGVTGYFISSPDPGLGLPPDATMLQWAEDRADGARTIVLGSRTMDLAELQALAEGLDIATDDDGRTIVQLPEEADLERFGESLAAPFIGGRGATGPDSMGWLVAYEQAVSANSGSLLVVTAGDDLDTAAEAYRFWSTSFEPVTVDGHRGFEATMVAGSDDMSSRSVLWAPAPGTVAILTYLGPEIEVDLVALAERTRELDDEAWEQYRLLSQQPESLGSDYDLVMGEGSGVIGESPYSWVIGIRGVDDLCFDLQTGSGGFGSCRPFTDVEASVEPGAARSIDYSVGEVTGSVVIAAGMDVEAVRETAGVGVIERVDAEGIHWFVYIGPPDHEPLFDVVVDGDVVETIEAAATEMATAEPAGVVDVAANPSAQELGIADGFEPIIDLAEPDLTVVIGKLDSDTCLVSDAPVVAATCLPGDVVRFRPLDARSAPSTFVVVAVPPCVGNAPELRTGNGVEEPYGQAVGVDDTPVTMWLLSDLDDAITISVTGPDGTEHRVTVADIEGSADWPETICG